MRKGWIIIILLAVVLLTGVVTVVSRNRRHDDFPQPAAGEENGRPVLVEAVPVTRGDLFRTIDFNVSFYPQSSVPVVPKVAGTVAEVYVAVGDRVQAGDLLFVIDDRQYRLQHKQAEAAYQAAQAQLTQARVALAGAEQGLANARRMLEERTQYRQQLQAAESQLKLAESQYQAAKAALAQAETALANAEEDYLRAAELFERKMISRQQLDGAKLQFESAKAAYEGALERLNQAKIGMDAARESLDLARDSFNDPLALKQQVDAAETQYEVARSTLQAAEAQVKQAGVALELAELQLDYTRVRAEIAGTIAELNVEKGSVSAPGTPAGLIIDNRKMKAKALVAEGQIPMLAPGTTVSLTANAWPGRTFSGRVATVSPLADRQTRLFPVEIVVENPGGELRAGMQGVVTLVTATAEDLPLLPVDAVLYDHDRPFVYVVENGRAVRRTIAVELESGDRAAVTAGVDEGDFVIIRGQHQVQDGTLVEVRT